MAPASSSAPRRIATSRPGPDPGRSAPRSRPLQIVPSRRANRAGAWVLRYLPVIMVVLALLVVVAGQAMLANGQVRMDSLDQRLQVAQGEHRQQVLNVAKLEVPSRIVGAAIGKQHMSHPSHITQLPYVSLDKPLPTPNVTPGATPPATTSATGSP
jgi:hypothetical protein